MPRDAEIQIEFVVLQSAFDAGVVGIQTHNDHTSEGAEHDAAIERLVERGFLTAGKIVYPYNGSPEQARLGCQITPAGREERAIQRKVMAETLAPLQAQGQAADQPRRDHVDIWQGR